MPSQRRRISPEMIIALSAVFVSLATLGVYIYQAHLMQNQLQASAWPYIQWSYVERSDQGIYLVVHNKGIGPALIKSAALSYQGEVFNNPSELIAKFLPVDSIGLLAGSIEHTVIAPGDRIEIFHVYVENNDEYQGYLKRLKPLLPNLDFRICYCDIYNECWTSTGREVVESECDDK